MIPDDFNLIHTFDERVRHTPDDIAVHLNGGAVRFAELDLAIKRLQLLVEPAARDAQTIAVTAHRTLASLTDLLTVLRMSKPYMPLDPTAPPERQRRQLEDARAAILLDEGRVQQTGIAPQRIPAGTAYIIYTSGSSGEPKGCLVTHRNVASMIAVALPYYDVGSQDIWSLFHRLSFDFSVWELWGAWSSGGSIRLMTEDEALDPRKFAKALDTTGVSVVGLVPSVFRQLTGTLQDMRCPAPSALRYVLFGGEPLFHDDVVAFDQLVQGQVRYINHYGLTETSVITSAYEMIPGEASPVADSIIGHALPTTEIELWPPDGEDTTDSDEGEIVVAGPHLFIGYLNRPELNSSRLVLARGRRWYRTGDLGTRDDLGRLIYRGRVDNQVKVQGFRVELGEIEAVLRRVDGIIDCAAVFEPTLAGGRTVLYCATELSQADASARIRSRSVERLPRYMHPRRVVVLPQLPVSRSGKIDKSRLRPD